MRGLFRVGAALVMAAVVMVTGVPAVAAAPAGTPGLATLDGRVIDLGKSWQGAQSCLVFAASDTRCFTSHAEADRVVGYQREADPLVAQARSAVVAAAVPSCGSGWLCLYENTNGGGRRLQFSDEYWHYLADWGFNRSTSSWRNNQSASDVGHLSLYNLTSVYNCGARSYALSMGIYNDQAYAVWG
ncbi:Peptidase inhibitor family I36 [Asanoa hainanensis]|uniref:Peptidase inhibitor family I36 n=1 Tax=Asanoa hainanensis TaxID=560556 RepID=A0A239NNN4_9ACTN|nr:peptidase inhibitor family I36 protein [Asanoa hainanensis]SNT55988.1 Peptidase inhibitor family I36 [Asanoa hainanensis]